MVENECFTTDFLRILCNLAVVFNGLKPSMYVHIHGEKKAQKFSPPAAGENPDPCHLSGPEMISYTFRHHTPSDTITQACRGAPPAPWNIPQISFSSLTAADARALGVSTGTLAGVCSRAPRALSESGCRAIPCACAAACLPRRPTRLLERECKRAK